MTVEYTILTTPLQQLMVAWRDSAVVSVRFGATLDRQTPSQQWRYLDGADNDVTRQLRAYFAGELREFDLEVDQRGTEFQRRVWREVAAIPFGETRSYGQVAAAIGRPTASRAVGAANGRNDVPIVVPCHRVIAGDGGLHGYAGGLELKASLLAFERTGRWDTPQRLLL
jgi:methylated-DNA-[protein]-cysteine S-methyltransferase